MRKLLLICMLGLSACTTVPSSVEPIPGSLIYGGQPANRLQKSPVGSTFSHDFRLDDNRKAIETYRIAPDRTYELINRVIVSDWPSSFSDR